jgi:hypothetical protein
MDNFPLVRITTFRSLCSATCGVSPTRTYVTRDAVSIIGLPNVSQCFNHVLHNQFEDTAAVVRLANKQAKPAMGFGLT